MTTISLNSPTEATAFPADENAAGAATPLLIDLDQAWIRTDPLMEMAVAYVAANPFRLVYFPVWILRGRACLGRKLAETIAPDPELMPVNEKVVELALEAKRRGRQVFLVTAGDVGFAQKVAGRFPFLDGLIASDGATDLTGSKKAALVSERFSTAYDYVGNSADDLEVWRNAGEIIAVTPDRATLRKIQALDKPTTVIEAKSRLRALVQAAGLHEWVKNTLILVPAVLSGTITDPATAIGCAFAFLALGLITLGTYLVERSPRPCP